MFLGYVSESTGYRLWCPGSEKVIQRDVTFNESTVFSLRKESTISLIGTSDHHDTSDKVELEAPIQGRVITSTLPYSSNDFPINEPDSSISSLDELRWRIYILLLVTG